MPEDKDFLNWYKKQIEDVAQHPPEKVWENIEKQLEIEEVWEELNNELDTYDAYWRFEKLAYLPILLLILMTFFYRIMKTNEDNNSSFSGQNIVQNAENPDQKGTNVQDMRNELIQPNDPGLEVNKGAFSNRSLTNQRNQENIKELSVGVTHSEPKIANEGNLIQTAKEILTKENLEKNQNSSDKLSFFTRHPDNRTSDVLVTVESASSSQDGKSYPEESGNETNIQSLQVRSWMLIPYDLPELWWANFDSLTMKYPIKEDDEKLWSPNGLYIGFSASVKNMWLLNRATFEGLESEELTTTLPDFGKDLGISVGWDFSNRWGLQSELYFISESGQKYKEYIHGKYLTREIDLSYVKVNLLLKYRKLRIAGHKRLSSKNLLLGAYGKGLSSAYEKVGNRKENISHTYNNHDLGMILGYEHQLYLMPKLVVSAGLRITYGLVNVYKGNEIIPADLRATNLGSVDLNFSIKYALNYNIKAL